MAIHLNDNANAALAGFFGGFTSQYDQRIGGGTNDAYSNQQHAGTVANSTPSTAEEASGENYGKTYLGGPGHSASGTKYELPSNGFISQLIEQVAHSGLAYATGSDIGTSVNSGVQAVQDLNNRHWRATQAEAKEAQGFNPTDVQQWVLDGNPKSLTANLGNRTIDVNGHPTLMTSENALAYENKQNKEKSTTTSQEGGDMVTRDAFGKEVSRTPATATIGEQETTRHNVVGETNETARTQSLVQTPTHTEDMGGFTRAYYADGHYVDTPKTANPDQKLKAGEKGQEIKEGNTSVNTVLKQQNTLMNQAKLIPDSKVADEITGLTGGTEPAINVTGSNGMFYGVHSKEGAEAISQLHQLQAQAKSIALAKNKKNYGPGMTDTDVENATAEVPKLDFKTKDRLKASIDRMNTYITDNQAVLKSQLKTQPTVGSNPYSVGASVDAPDGTYQKDGNTIVVKARKVVESR